MPKRPGAGDLLEVEPALVKPRAPQLCDSHCTASRQCTLPLGHPGLHLWRSAIRSFMWDWTAKLPRIR